MQRYEIDNFVDVGGIINTVGGVAGKLIDLKAQGKALSAAEEQTRQQALQIQAALQMQQNQQPKSSLGAGGTTTVIILGVVALVVIIMVFKMTSK